MEIEQRWKQWSPLFHLLKCFACCPKLHHLNHIFALLPVIVIHPSVPLSFPRFPLSSHAPSSSSGSVTFRPLYKRLRWLIRGEFASGTPQGESTLRPRRVWNQRSRQPSSTSACLSVCIVSFFFFFRVSPRFSRRPRSPSAIAHAPLNPYPDSLGLNADLFFHREKHPSVFLTDAQTKWLIMSEFGLFLLLLN